MKKNLFMVAAVALVALVSCNKETDSPLQPAPVSDIKFEAEFVNEQTKTSLGEADENGYRNVTWDLGEEVYINGTLFTATGHKEDGKAIFETENLDFAAAEKYDAIYPASAGKSLDAVTIPAAQDGTFANAAIAVAQSENRSLAFMNVASLIKFQVESNCSTITITSNLNLTGKVSVTFDENGYPVLGSNVSEPSKTITLTGAFKAGQDYYVAALPGSHTFTVHIDSYLSKEGTKPVTLTRSNIANLKTLPSPEASTWVIVGAYNSWKNDATAKKLYKDISGFVVKNITLNGEFKMVNGSKWLSTMVPSAAQNKWCLLKENMANMTRSSGTYDIWISLDGKEVCVVNSGSSAPQLNDSHRQYYIVLQHNWDWANRRLHAWIDNGSDATNVNLMGNWPGKAANGTFTYDNSGYSYWEIPNSVYGKKLGIIFSNNGGDQTQNKYFTNYRDDKRFWLEWKDPNRIANEF